MIKENAKIAKKLHNGEEIQQLVLTQDQNQIMSALDLLANEESSYKSNYFKMWLFMVFGIILGLAFSPMVVVVSSTLGYSFYKRDGLDSLLLEYLDHNTFEDITIDELVIASFDYNSHTPRFFSKHFAQMSPSQYDVELRIAVGGSAAAPTYFDPEVYDNGLGYQESLVDGGIICNNPVMYAYSIAKFLKGIKIDETKGEHFNIISLGTGESKVDQ